MRVVVIGDSCRDVFIYGAVDRICPEGPVPVLKKDWEKGNNGMAMNVVTVSYTHLTLPTNREV